MKGVTGFVRKLAIKEMTQGSAGCLSSWAGHEEQFKQERSDKYRSHVGWQCIKLAWCVTVQALLGQTKDKAVIIKCLSRIAGEQKELFLFERYAAVHQLVRGFSTAHWYNILNHRVQYHNRLLDSFLLHVKNLYSTHASREILLSACVCFSEREFL